MKSLPMWSKIAVGAIILLGLWWRFEVYAHRSWAIDEINEYKNTEGPLKPFWTKANYGEVYSFPGDYLLTYPFVAHFGENKMAVAVPHILATFLSFTFLVLLCRRHLRHPASWLVTFLVFAMNRELIFHALELRPYSVLICLGLSTFYLMDNLLNPSIPLAPYLYPLYFIYLTLTSIYHPYGFIIIFFCGLYFVLGNFRRGGFWPKIRQHAVFWGLTAFTCAGLWVYYSTSPYSLHLSSDRPVFQYIPNPMDSPLGFLRNVVGSLLGNKLFYPLLIGVLIRLFYPARERFEMLAFLLVMFILPVLLILYSDNTMHYWFLQRQFIWLSALFPLFIGTCWDRIFP